MISISTNNQKDTFTICLAMSSYPNHAENILNELFKQDFNDYHVLCLMDGENPENQDLIGNFQKSNENIQTADFNRKDDLLKNIHGEYLIYVDSKNCYRNMNLNDLRDFLKKHDCDVLYFNSDFTYENVIIPFENDSSMKKDFINKVFLMPKFTDGIYRTDYLKKINAEIPKSEDYSEKLLFHFNTMLSTSKIRITEKALFDKRNFNHDICEYILTDFALKTVKINDYNLDTDKFFQTLDNLFDIFEEKELTLKYNYQIFNYVFNLLKNIYESHPLNEEEYFVKLKEFVDKMSDKHYTTLSLQLKYDNLQFWKNVSESHSLSELNLRYDYEELLTQKEKAEYKQKSLTKHINKFLTGRIDIKNKGTSGNSVEVVDAIEGNVNMRFPSWFKDSSGSGLIVESSEGVIDFSVRCVGDGVFTLWLKGVDFRDVNGSRVPVFVDFTSLVVDGEVVFDENRLVSHDSSFVFKKNVTDGDEVNVHAEWIPLNKKSTYPIKKERKTKNTNPLLQKYLIGRFDIKNRGTSGNSVEVVDAIEGNVNMRFPSWFKDSSGSGLIVESSEGVIDFSVRCVGDGVFTLWLKGVDFRDVNGSRVPVFVDFTSLVVDGEVVFDENRLVSHDSSFVFKKNVTDGDEVNVHAEWIPLNKKSRYSVKKR